MGSSFNKDDDIIAGINITPLVDVVLVLLIIFLITAPVIYQSALPIKLPKAESGEETKTTPLRFMITKEGDLYLEQDKMDWNTLNDKLNAHKNKDDMVLVSADNDATHGKVITLLDALRKAGLTKIALTVESSKKEK